MITQQKFEDSFRLSPVQEGMLFHTLSQPESDMYVRQILFDLHEAIHPDLMKLSWKQVVDRHPILRTSIRWVGVDFPVHEIYSHIDLPFAYFDWSALSIEEQNNKHQSYVYSDRHKGFDLTSSPLMRLTLFKIAKYEFRLLWTFHHTLSDGFSDLIVMKEIFEIYNARCQGKELKLELPISYNHYCKIMREYEKEGEQQYWRNKMCGFTTPNRFWISQPIKKIRDGEDDRGESEIVLSKALSSRLRAFANDYGVTLTTIIQGAWALLINRYSGEDDLVFGGVRGCRKSDMFIGEGVKIVGPFINTLPVRIRYQASQSVSEWLRTIQKQWVELRNYENTPLIDILNWCELPHVIPLFDSIVSFDKSRMQTVLRAGGGELWKRRSLKSIRAKSNFAITLAAYGEEEIIFELLYDKQRFDDKAINRVLHHLKGVLNNITYEPKQPLSNVSLMDEVTQKTLLATLNNNDEINCELLLHQIVEKQAALKPDSIAAKFENLQITYHELNFKANQVARFLLKRGIGPENIVSIYLDRGLEMLISILAILKTGAAWAPIEPATPSERVEFILEDTESTLVITQQRYSDKFTNIDLINIDADWVSINCEDGANLYQQGSIDNSAYVIYTSGSTGKPKGVVVTHRNIVCMIDSADRHFNFNDNDIWTMFHSYAFDFSEWEMWGALTRGGRVIIITQQISRSPELFLDLISKERITVLNQTPSAFKQLIAEEEKRDDKADLSLKYIIFGGEALDFSALQHWIRRRGDNAPKLINMYGITETTVHVTYRRITRADAEVEKISFIGQPIDGWQVYILDEQMQLLPTGVVGEIYVGGSGLARGYMKKADLTAERFVVCPFSVRIGERLYKTGDRGRYIESNDLEYLGRNDNQVKIRGFRIEPGEIENVLSKHHAVREAVVIVDESVEYRKLNAYVVLSEQCPINDLRKYLKNRLPDYMIPSGIISLDAIPLTSNGKIDRRTLQDIQLGNAESESRLVFPRTDTEEIISQIWSEILGLEKISIYDDFFDSGGHSLLATQLISRIRDNFIIDIPLTALFESPTVAGLAKVVEKARYSGQGGGRPPLIAVSREKPLPLSFSQQRLWFINRLSLDSPVYNVPLAFRIIGMIDRVTLEKSVKYIIQRHEIFRTRILYKGEEAVQVIDDHAKFKIDEGNLSNSDITEDRLFDLLRTEASRLFNLDDIPLLRAKIWRLTDEENILMFNFHHIVSDGWSLSIFLHELSALYNSNLSGKSIDLQPLSIQYADYSVWQRTYFNCKALSGSLSYWKQQLKDVPWVLELPTDYARPETRTFVGAEQPLELTMQEVAGIKKLAIREKATVFMTLFSVFGMLLSRWTGADEILIGTPIACRNTEEIEHVIGFFVNALALKADLRGNPDFHTVLKRVKKTALEAYLNQDLPFERLVEELQPDRESARSPLFQVGFSLQAAPWRILQLNNLVVSPIRIDTQTSKFDLFLYFFEDGDRIHGWVSYSPELFDFDTISRLITRYFKLLDSIIANPDQLLGDIDILIDEEKKILDESNNITGFDTSFTF